MSAHTQLNEILDSFPIESHDEKKFSELKDCFDENHVEVFLDKLGAMPEIDQYVEETNDHTENESNKFIDFVSELIIDLK